MNKIFILTLVFALLLVTGVFAGAVMESVVVNNSPVAPGEDLEISLRLECEAGDPAEINVREVYTNDFFGNHLTLISDLDINCTTGRTDVLSFAIPVGTPQGDYTHTLTIWEVTSSGEHRFRSAGGQYQFTVSGSTPGGGTTNTTTTRNVDLRLRGSSSTFTSATLEDNTDFNDNTYVLSLVNTGTEDLTNLVLTFQNQFTDDDGDVLNINLNTTSVSALNIGQQANLEISFQVQNGFDARDLTGFVINVNSGTETIKSFPVTLNVRPLACHPNAQGRFSFDIEGPEDNDDFERGDLVNVDLDVTNNAGDDTDMRLEASLYNLGRGSEIDSDRFARDNVDDDEDESFQFALELDDSVRDNDNVILFLKAYDRSNPHGSCKLEEVSLNVEVPDHKINIEQLQLNPSTVQCGQRVAGSALLRNVGENDEDVTIRVSNNDLGTSVSSETFEIEDGDERQINFLFDVPANAAQGTYNMLVMVFYDDEDESTTESVSLAVTCSEAEEVSEEEVTTRITGLAAGTENAVEYTEKSLFDLFNKPGAKIPTSVWVLLDVLLVLLIIGALVWLFKSK